MNTSKSNFLILPLLLLSFKVLSQNYEPVAAGKEYLYSVPNKSTLNKPFYNSPGKGPIGIRVKNYTTIGQSKIYFFNGHIRNGCDSISCFGKKELVEVGRCVFFNVKGDSIIFKSNLPNGSTWPIYTYPDGSYLEAAITGIKAITVLKYTDTAKYISLTYKDKVGNNLLHIFNNKSIILGKNLGFIRSYDLAAFPADTNALDLAGISSPAIGIQNIKEKDIFDFEVGDEFHYKMESRGWPSSSNPGWSYWYSNVILGKTVSANGDTLTYKIHERYSGGKHDTTTLRILSNASSYYTNQSRHFNTIPIEEIGNSEFSHSELFLEDTFTYKTLSNYYTSLGSPSPHCYRGLIGMGIFNNYTYTAGRGMVSIVGDTKSTNQVYYKKKNKEWGTPINFKELGNYTSTETSRTIEISPNPVSDFINIKSKSQAFISDISISNLLGNEMMSQEIPANTLETQINVSHLSNGIYLLRTKNGSGEHVTKFVVAK